MASQTKSRFDPNFTQHVIDTTGANISKRNKFVMSSLIRHLHDFIREVELTPEEWMAGVHFINSIGQISTPTRNEGHRISDVLGVESLVDEVANSILTESDDDIPTSSAILGPFYSALAPVRELGSSIIQDPVSNGQVCYMHGQILDYDTKKPIPNAQFEIWQASANGKYDFQDPENQSDNNLRGKFKADAEGKYYFYCYRPTAYSLPTDGPSFQLLNLLDRHPMRPAHIHLMVSHPDYRPLVNQIYPRDDPWLETDTVFAVKPDLIVDFKPIKTDPKATLELEYNVILVPKGHKGLPQTNGVNGQ